ncbi:MAG: 2-oxoglutarate dehydrogenase, E2 component, dihydrolipoamide succinyltransferase, partial [Actinobacteria bacterium]|nr:2-oxoglutarate dehydrogenase, E2 component, dihydrolipoamide succinyltransferase [Actinomycetota bacterium]
MPSPVAGVLQKIVVQVDSTVAVGAELAVIAESGSATKPAAQTPAPVASPAPVAPPAPTPTPVAQVQVSTPAPAASSGATIVSMPALGESVTEGTVTRWLKKVGEAVAADEALLEVSTDKVDTEIPSPVSGTVLSIDVPVDSTVAVGARLASIGVSGASAPAAKPTPVAPVATPAPKPVPTPAPVAAAPAPVIAPTPVAATPVSSSRADDAYVTPIVRKLAAEAGVNLATIKGTGVGGRIRKEDILAATPRASATPTATVMASTAAAPRGPLAVSPLRGTTVSMSRLRKVIADRMVESLKISAQLTTVVEVDVTKID